MTDRIQIVSLKDLRPGDDFPGGSINPRKTGQKDGIDLLASEIDLHGLLHNLVGGRPASAKEKGLVYIGNGNRRLLAFQLLVKQKKAAEDAPIPVLILSETDPKKLLRASLSTDTVKSLHPADQVEAFVGCAAQGETAEDIANRYVLPLKTVKQRLALGNLSSAVLDAWRKGKLTVEAAAAYAATPHHAAQEKLLKRGGWESTNAHQIRRHLIGDAQDIAHYLKFVGEAAYKAAGGKLIEDLFAEKEGAKIADFGLLKRLAEEKLKAAAADYVAKGWGWAITEDQLASGQHFYSLPVRVKPSADEKKKLGVVLRLDHNGKIEAKLGVLKPGTKGIAASDEKAKKKASPTALSNSLKEKLEKTGWFALKTALGNQPYPKGIATTLGGLIAGQIKPEGYPRTPDIIDNNFKTLRDGVDQKIMEAALVKHFDVKDYFMKAPKLIVCRAIAELADAAQAKKYAAGTKSAAWKFALQRIGKTGWLPAELRFPGYTGPGGKAKKGR